MSSVSFVVKPNSNTSNIAHFVPAELTKKRVNSPVQKAVPRMRYDFEDNPKSDIVYREIESSDFEVIKTLHEELFPVKYSDAFYQNTCNGIGVGGGRLYSSLAVLSGRVIGFILAQMVLYPSKSEDRDLFSIDKQPKYVCYILTLGLTKTCRRSGLGTKLIQRCEEYASLNWDCGAVRFHKILVGQ